MNSTNSFKNSTNLLGFMAEKIRTRGIDAFFGAAAKSDNTPLTGSMLVATKGIVPEDKRRKLLIDAFCFDLSSNLAPYSLKILGVLFHFSFNVVYIQRRFITTCTITSQHASWVGHAKCNPEDDFNLYEGRKLALERALEAANIEVADYKAAIKQARRNRK